MSGRIDISGTPGAILRPQFMQRTSMVYAIYDTEMDTLSTLNHISTVAFAFSGSAASFAFSLYVQSEISPAATARGQAIIDIGVPIGSALAIAAATVGLIAWFKRGGTLKKIKDQSRAISPDAISGSRQP